MLDLELVPKKKAKRKMDKIFDAVDEWDPDAGCMGEHRVLDNPSDAESKEEFFKVKTGEAGGEKLVRYYRPSKRVRRATGARGTCAEEMDERYEDERTDDNSDGIPRLRV